MTAEDADVIELFTAQGMLPRLRFLPPRHSVVEPRPRRGSLAWSAMARHLLVTNDFPPKTGGIQVYLHELWRRLEPGRAVVLTANSHPDAARFDAGSAPASSECRRKHALPADARGAPRAIEAAIARHQPDLVLLDPAWPLGLLGPCLSVPYGVVLHGAEVTIPGRLPVVRVDAALRAATRRGRRVRRLVPRGRGATQSPPSYCRPSIQVPPGVDTRRFRPLDDARAERA